jgi:hypothetical protein
MAEVNQYSFTLKEAAEALIKKQGLHEGLWSIYFEFGLSGATIQDASGQALPAAIVPIIKLGLQRVEEPTPLSVNAAQVNPTHKKK